MNKYNIINTFKIYLGIPTIFFNVEKNANMQIPELKIIITVAFYSQ